MNHKEDREMKQTWSMLNMKYEFIETHLQN